MQLKMENQKNKTIHNSGLQKLREFCKIGKIPFAGNLIFSRKLMVEVRQLRQAMKR
jgi:hypothetical protein